VLPADARAGSASGQSVCFIAHQPSAHRSGRLGAVWELRWPGQTARVQQRRPARHAGRLGATAADLQEQAARSPRGQAMPSDNQPGRRRSIAWSGEGGVAAAGAMMVRHATGSCCSCCCCCCWPRYISYARRSPPPRFESRRHGGVRGLAPRRTGAAASLQAPSGSPQRTHPTLGTCADGADPGGGCLLLVREIGRGGDCGLVDTAAAEARGAAPSTGNRVWDGERARGRRSDQRETPPGSGLRTLPAGKV